MIPADPLVSRVGEALTAHEVGWAVAGGWAIDLFIGRVTRSHADVDIAVWRDEHQQVREALPGWRFSIADAGELRPWLAGTLIATDEADFHNALPRLDEAARKWLADAVARADADHPWVAMLRDADG